MRDIRKNKKINIHKNNPALIGRFKQRTNATLILDLYDEFSNYVDLTNQEISIRVERPDGLHFEQVNNITKSSNILTVKLKNEVLEVVGKCRVELNLKDSEGQMNTADFFFEVVESVLSDDIVFSSEDYESLEKALVVFRTESNALMKKLDDNEKVRISNENTRKSQETSRVNAENNRVSKENERINQENTRKNQEETRKSNETTRQNQERVRQESENTRKSQETNRVNKENERKTNEDTRKTNESDRQTRFTKLESDGRKLMAEMNTAIDGTITREVTEARGNKSKLGLRLNDIEQQSVENTNRIEQLEDLTPVWQEHEGRGNITVNDSFDGVTKDLTIKGRTLKNIKELSSSFIPGNVVLSNNGDVFRGTSNSSASGYIGVSIANKHLLKPNTTYTMFTQNYLQSGANNSKVSIHTKNTNVQNDFVKVRDNVFKVTITTVDANNEMRILFYCGTTGYVEVNRKILLLEGDWSNYDIPYFDGIKSMGDQENNKVKIKSIGKNLCKVNRISTTPAGAGWVNLDGSSSSLGTGNETVINIFRAGVYSMSAELGRNVTNIQLVNLNNEWVGTGKNTSSLSAGRYVLRIKVVEGNKLATVDNIILNEGSVATNYEQYRAKLIEIPLPFAKGLKSTLDGTIFDEINGNTGEIIQRVSDEYTALAKPIIHKITDVQLSTFDTTTHITQENNILSDISFKAKVSLSSQAKRLTEENKALKEENRELRESSIKTTEEQEVQDQKITTTMLANTELFEMMLNFMPMQLDDKQFRGGEMNMVEVYVTLIIQGDKTLEQVPAIIRPQVEAKLRLLGIIA